MVFVTCCNCKNCSCQWGLSGILLGIIIILAACVFTFFPAFLDIFAWEWYEDLCKLWFGIGGVILAAGAAYSCKYGCDSYETWDVAKKEYNILYALPKLEADKKKIDSAKKALDDFAKNKPIFQKDASLKARE